MKNITIFLMLLWMVLPAGASFSITPEGGSFPVSVGAIIPASVFVGDLDGDGNGEMVVETYDNIFCYNHTGTLKWSAALSGAHMTVPKMADPMAGNIAGDSRLEVVFGDKSSKKLYVWNSNGTSLSGFPKTLSGNIFSSAALADVDSDGYSEIAIGDDSNSVYLFDGDGNQMPGWPVAVGGNVRSQPAFGDIDNDGETEIIVTSSSYDGNNILFSSAYAFNLDGTNAAGWPKDIMTAYGTGTRHTSPAVGDLDNDGIPEVVIASTYEYSNEGKVIAFYGDGTELWVGTTTLNPYSSPVIGNIDRDIYNEVVVGGLWNVYAYEHDGTVKWINSIGNTNEVDSVPGIMDITGDAVKEVFVSTKNGNIYGWYGDGTIFLQESAGNEVFGAPSIFDIDADGDLEIVVGTGPGSLLAWNIDFVPVNPSATIIKPVGGSEFTKRKTIEFRGSGNDADGYITDVEWHSNRDGLIGTGLNFNTPDLSAGTHLISLRVFDNDGLTWTDQTTIKVLGQETQGGGGGGATGEDFYNIEKAEFVSQLILNGKRISYEFKNTDPIISLEFTALRSAGSVTANIEVLNNKSSLITDPAPHNVYRNVNIYVGLYGFANEQNIKDSIVSFRVAKDWLELNEIDETSVSLYRNIEGKWVEQPTEIISQDDTHYIYRAHVAGFSQFAVSGIKRDELPVSTATAGPVNDVQDNDIKTDLKRINSLSMFAVLTLILTVFILMKYKKI